MTHDWTDDLEMLRGLLQREAAECGQIAALNASLQRADLMEAAKRRRDRCVALAGTLVAPGPHQVIWHNPEKREGDDGDRIR
jgi:hypothetical protein